MGEKFPRILPKVATYTSLLGSFICCKFTAWDGWLYFPSEGRRAEDFFARKIPRLRPGLNPRTWVTKASTLTSRPLKPLQKYLYSYTSNITILYMFRALSCSSSGGYFVYVQHLLPSHIQFNLLKMSIIMRETCRGL